MLYPLSYGAVDVETCRAPVGAPAGNLPERRGGPGRGLRVGTHLLAAQGYSTGTDVPTSVGNGPPNGAVMTPYPTPTDSRSALRSLPTQHTPPRWRQQALGLLVDAAVTELSGGVNPRRSIRGMVGLADARASQDVTDVIERRLDESLASWVEQQRRARLADPEADLEEIARALVAPFFDHLPVPALDGCPHPGSWFASSVDELPCAVHGYESDAVDCLRMLVETYLVDTVDRAVAHADSRPAPLPRGAQTLAGMWLGVAVLAAWRARTPVMAAARTATV